MAGITPPLMRPFKAWILDFMELSFAAGTGSFAKFVKHLYRELPDNMANELPLAS
jgi:hypothetical protein